MLIAPLNKSKYYYKYQKKKKSAITALNNHGKYNININFFKNSHFKIIPTGKIQVLMMLLALRQDHQKATIWLEQKQKVLLAIRDKQKRHCALSSTDVEFGE